MARKEVSEDLVPDLVDDGGYEVLPECMGPPKTVGTVLLLETGLEAYAPEVCHDDIPVDVLSISLNKEGPLIVPDPDLLITAVHPLFEIVYDLLGGLRWYEGHVAVVHLLPHDVHGDDLI